MARNKNQAYYTENEPFATNLRYIMEKRGLNPYKLEDKIDKEFGETMQRQTIAQYKTGQSHPDTNRLTILCKALDVSADYLLGFIPEDNSTRDEKLRAASEYTGLSNDALFVITNVFKGSGWISLLSTAIEHSEFRYLFIGVERIQKQKQFLEMTIEIYRRIRNGESIDDALKDSHAFNASDIESYRSSFAQKHGEFLSRGTPNADRISAQRIMNDAFDSLELALWHEESAWREFLESEVPTKETLRIAEELIDEKWTPKSTDQTEA